MRLPKAHSMIWYGQREGYLVGEGGLPFMLYGSASGAIQEEDAGTD
jgi:hypothetical protein